jgi:hypothetical protein
VHGAGPGSDAARDLDCFLAGHDTHQIASDPTNATTR